MPESIYNRRLLCKEILILYSVFFLPGIVAQSGALARPSFDSVVYNIQIVVVAVPQLLLTLYILQLHPGSTLRAFGIGRIHIRDIGGAALSFLALVALFVPVALLVALVSDELSRDAIPAVTWTFNRPAMLPLIAIAMVTVGYREELFFRSYLITRLEQLGLGGAASVGISTLLFALGHIYQGVAGVAVALVIGALFGVLFRRRRNLHEIAIAHTAYNLSILVGRYALGFVGH